MIFIFKTSELIEKLGEAIALDEENDLLYFNRGTIYDQEGDMINAEKDYLIALEFKPNYYSNFTNLNKEFEGFANKNKN